MRWGIRGRFQPASLLLVASVATASGCVTVDCGPPSQIDGTYDVFANVVEYDEAQLVGFPAAYSPVNGNYTWTLVWDIDSNAAVSVAIDGQPFDAGAAWDPAVCGYFTMSFAGQYASEANTTHQFTTGGDFTVFGDQLEGEWTWSEIWQDSSGTSGVFEAVGRVSGVRRAVGD